MSAIRSIASKELYVAVKTKRFIIILATYLLFIFLMLYFEREWISQSKSSVVHQSMLGASGPVYMTPISSIFINNAMLFMFFGAFLGILLGADAINREITRGTIKVLLGHPVYRDEVVNGKFLGNALALVLVIFIGFMFTISLALIFGIPMEGLSITRLLLLSILLLLYTLVFLSLGIMISSLIRSPETAMLIGVGLVIFFIFIYPLIASLIADRMVGPEPECYTIMTERVEIVGTSTFTYRESSNSCEDMYREWQEEKQAWEKRINMLNPVTHFAQLMIYTFAGDEEANDFLPLSESLGYGINNLAILIVELLFPFSIAYMRFMTRDLR
ncbi:ABC transporter permease [Pyrococcus abyssi]|uniref:ABC transporter permease n=1 Tax=Pyrococcus abyssi (strain GE5 / Orsay) TaxID=272844 RepID=Q9V0L1_PYRAB|nr:ABC transporter permease [Pyrococcus abyssi]CAB49692.1 Hypothetical protein PAB1848 [Pyrococcus abyssi GE5]CCE70175.1 TPA: hypothetical protein PAB1848 [Pyrococcus abyssi GE5]